MSELGSPPVHRAVHRGLLVAIAVALLVVALDSGRAAPTAAVPRERGALAVARPSLAVVVHRPSGGAPSSLTIALRHWPVGAVTLTVCGGAVRRGSVDCDLRGSQGAAVGPDGTATASLPLSPPAPCPCVVMVWSPTHALLETARADLRAARPGPPGSPEPGPAPGPKLSPS